MIISRDENYDYIINSNELIISRDENYGWKLIDQLFPKLNSKMDQMS